MKRKKNEKEMDKQFWSLVRKLGYPSSPKGLAYGSEEYEIYTDIRWFWKMAKRRDSGGRIGWVAGMSYSRICNELPLVHLAARYVLDGREGMIAALSKGIGNHPSWAVSYLENAREELEKLEEWIKKGGTVNEDSFSEAKENIRKAGEALSEDWYENYRRIVEVFGEGEDLESIKKFFEFRRRKIMETRDELLDFMRDLCEKSGLDFEKVMN